MVEVPEQPFHQLDKMFYIFSVYLRQYWYLVMTITLFKQTSMFHLGS